MGALFSIQRSIHDSCNRIYNHSFCIGYGLENLHEVPSKRLNCTVTKERKPKDGLMSLNIISIIPSLLTLTLYIIYIFWCYNSKTEDVSENEHNGD